MQGTGVYNQMLFNGGGGEESKFNCYERFEKD